MFNRYSPRLVPLHSLSLLAFVLCARVVWKTPAAYELSTYVTAPEREERYAHDCVCMAYVRLTGLTLVPSVDTRGRTTPPGHLPLVFIARWIRPSRCWIGDGDAPLGA